MNFKDARGAALQVMTLFAPGTLSPIMHSPFWAVASARTLKVPIWVSLPIFVQMTSPSAMGSIGAQRPMSSLLCRAVLSALHWVSWVCMDTIFSFPMRSRSEQLLSCAACSSSALSLSASEAPHPELRLNAMATRRAANENLEKLVLRRMGRLLSFTGRGS